MKRWTWIIVALTIMCCSWRLRITSELDFQIYNSMKVGADNCESVTLQVIVKGNDYEKIFEEIYLFYCEDGAPDELTINLYSSVQDLKDGKIRKTKIYCELNNTIISLKKS